MGNGVHMSTMERILKKVTVRTDGCWQFTGAVWRGYGRIHVDSGTRLVHRVAWEAANGPIPDGLTIEHRCNNTLCVNTEHMELVTRAENARRARMRTGWGEHQRRKTHCRNGHPFTPENTHIVQRSNGKTERRCKTCARDAERRYTNKE